MSFFSQASKDWFILVYPSGEYTFVWSHTLSVIKKKYPLLTQEKMFALTPTISEYVFFYSKNMIDYK